MGKRGAHWLIGAKLVCCGTLLLVLTGVVSLGTIATLLIGNAIPIAAGSSIIALLIVSHIFKVRRA